MSFVCFCMKRAPYVSVAMQNICVGTEKLEVIKAFIRLPKSMSQHPTQTAFTI